jgi:hypothetical protein
MSKKKAPALPLRAPARQFWGVIVNFRGTPDEVAKQVRERKLKRHVRHKMLLDLIVDSLPKNEPLPENLIALLQHELGLPKNHQWGSWPLVAGMHDDRGNPDHEARECAALIAEEYFEQHLKPMPLLMLERELKAKLGRTLPRASLRRFRKAGFIKISCLIHGSKETFEPFFSKPTFWVLLVCVQSTNTATLLCIYPMKRLRHTSRKSSTLDSAPLPQLSRPADC